MHEWAVLGRVLRFAANGGFNPPPGWWLEPDTLEWLPTAAEKARIEEAKTDAAAARTEDAGVREAAAGAAGPAMLEEPVPAHLAHLQPDKMRRERDYRLVLLIFLIVIVATWIAAAAGLLGQDAATWADWAR